MRSLYLASVLNLTLIFAPQVHASTVDVVEAPTGFFVPTDAEKGFSPYYRGFGEDWSWTHGAIGGMITTAELLVSAYDVDFSSGERDGIYVTNNGVEVFLGYLAGSNNQWAYTTFALSSDFFDEIATGLQILIKIDEGEDDWFVTLGKSALSINGAAPPPPTPGEIPIPAALPLFASGVAAIGYLSRARRRNA